MSILKSGFINSHRALLRWTKGRVGSRLAGIEHLLLTTKGRKTGLSREHPLACFRIGTDQMVVASNGGQDRSPAWFLNLVADPEVSIRVGGEPEPRSARVLTSAERNQVWPELVRMNRAYAVYQAKTRREIPVVILGRGTGEA